MKLSVPKPCDADWDQMKIGLNSRHCEICEKDVIDFRTKSKEEITFYLLSRPKEKTCGRFYRHQLDYIHLEKMITLKELRKMPRSKAFTVLTLACACLIACQAPQTNNRSPSSQKDSIEVVSDIETTENQSIPIDTAKSDTVIQGQRNTDTETDLSSIDFTLGMVEMEGEIELTGDVIYELPDNSYPAIFDSLEDVNRRLQSERVYKVVEKMPEFPGGIDSLYQFIQNTCVYPEEVSKRGVQGKVYVKFIVEKDGSLSNIEIVRTLKDEPELDNEVIRVIKLMPHWIPGELNNEKVRVEYIIPIRFEIR